MATEFRKWWDEFRSRTDQQQQHIQFFKNKAAILNLDSAQEMISVGAGDGDIDVHLITHCMPRLSKYTGVEPDDDNRACLDTLLKQQCPQIEVSLISTPVPQWPGPGCNHGDQVDVVLAVQVLWYLGDKVQAITDMMTWVKPGGSLIIGHTCDDFIFARLIEQYGYRNGEKEYYLQELKADLRTAGYNDYDEYLVPCQFRTINPDERMLRYIVAAESASIDEEAMKICLDRARELCTEKQPYASFNNVFIRIKKPEDSSNGELPNKTLR